MNVPAHVGWYDRKASIPYGRESRQTLDVYAPVGAFNRPIVVFWYGGIWTKGTKEDYRFVGASLRVKQTGPESYLCLHQDPSMVDEDRHWSMNIIVP